MAKKKDIHQLQPYINKEAPEGYKIIHNNRNSFLFKSENTSHKCPSMTLSSCNELQWFDPYVSLLPVQI